MATKLSTNAQTSGRPSGLAATANGSATSRTLTFEQSSTYVNDARIVSGGGFTAGSASRWTRRAARRSLSTDRKRRASAAPVSWRRLPSPLPSPSSSGKSGSCSDAMGAADSEK